MSKPSPPESGDSARPRARVVAYYLPQFHVVPENEQWWGESFTDWVNVRRARPLFAGHYQPRVPLNGNYYDLTDVHALHAQVDLAREFGLTGFCHYHYWFDGRRILERPTDLFLKHPELDFGFCLAWANATWSRRWTASAGRGRTLIRQTYSSRRERWLDHFECLFNAWSDVRHLRVDGKPLFLVYNPHEIPHMDAMFDLWREEAERRGLGGLHIVAMQHFPFVGTRFLRKFDAIVLAQPGAAMFIPSPGEPTFSKISFERFLRGLPHPLAETLRVFRSAMPGRLRFHDYENLWKKILAQQTNGRNYPGAFVDWDNTPRYERTARVVIGASPDRFRYWFNQLVDRVAEQPYDRRLIFVNAWNEWAEGAYLEPDERFGFAYLEAIRDSVIGGRVKSEGWWPL